MARAARKMKTVAVAAEAAAETEAHTVAEVAAIPAPPEAGATSEATSAPETAAPAASGEAVFVPLNKLKKSPRNARKTPHTEAIIKALAASIAVKGLLQNLVVEPERDPAGEPTGSYFVTVGEGRRLALLLRAKRKEIGKTEPVRCVIDTANDPHEISLDENVNGGSLDADQDAVAWANRSGDIRIAKDIRRAGVIVDDCFHGSLTAPSFAEESG